MSYHRIHFGLHHTVTPPTKDVDDYDMLINSSGAKIHADLVTMFNRPDNNIPSDCKIFPGWQDKTARRAFHSFYDSSSINDTPTGNKGIVATKAMWEDGYTKICGFNRRENHFFIFDTISKSTTTIAPPSYSGIIYGVHFKNSSDIIFYSWAVGSNSVWIWRRVNSSWSLVQTLNVTNNFASGDESQPTFFAGIGDTFIFGLSVNSRARTIVYRTVDFGSNFTLDFDRTSDRGLVGCVTWDKLKIVHARRTDGNTCEIRIYDISSASWSTPTVNSISTFLLSTAIALPDNSVALCGWGSTGARLSISTNLYSSHTMVLDNNNMGAGSLQIVQFVKRASSTEYDIYANNASNNLTRYRTTNNFSSFSTLDVVSNMHFGSFGGPGDLSVGHLDTNVFAGMKLSGFHGMVVSGDPNFAVFLDNIKRAGWIYYEKNGSSKTPFIIDMSNKKQISCSVNLVSFPFAVNSAILRFFFPFLDSNGFPKSLVIDSISRCGFIISASSSNDGAMRSYNVSLVSDITYPGSAGTQSPTESSLSLGVNSNETNLLPGNFALIVIDKNSNRIIVERRKIKEDGTGIDLSASGLIARDSSAFTNNIFVNTIFQSGVKLGFGFLGTGGSGTNFDTRWTLDNFSFNVS